MELDSAKVLLVGFIATLLIQIIKLAMTALKMQRPSEKVMLWVSFGISFLLAVAFLWKDLVAAAGGVTEPAVFFELLIQYAPMIFGLAYAIYKLFAKKVIEDWGNLSPEKLLIRGAAK